MLKFVTKQKQECSVTLENFLSTRHGNSYLQVLYKDGTIQTIGTNPRTISEPLDYEVTIQELRNIKQQLELQQGINNVLP